MWQANSADSDRDGRGFEAFFVANRAAALRQARRLVNDGAASEDLVAEAFAKMWARWSDGAIDDPVRYLSRIIRNGATDHFRRLARERQALSRVSGSAARVHRDPTGTVLEAREIVIDLLDRVSPTQRRALSLRYLRDFTEAQTARSLGVSLGTVKSSTSRGLHRMRELSELQGDAA